MPRFFMPAGPEQLRYRRRHCDKQSDRRHPHRCPHTAANGDRRQILRTQIAGHHRIDEADRNQRELRGNQRTAKPERGERFFSKLSELHFLIQGAAPRCIGFSAKTNSLTGRPSARCS